MCVVHRLISRQNTDAHKINEAKKEERKQKRATKMRAWESRGHVTYMWPLKILNIRYQLARDRAAGASLPDKWSGCVDLTRGKSLGVETLHGTWEHPS